MPDFGDLRRQAERTFGEEAVRRAEEELRKQTGVDSDNRELVSASNVDFTPVAKALMGSADPENSDVAPVQPLGLTDMSPPDQPEETNPNSPSAPRETGVAPVPLPAPPQSESPSGSYSHQLLDRAIKGEYLYGTLGLVLGLVSVVGGMILCLNGVAGSTSWTANLLGLESNINDAAPGVVLFIVGIFLVWITRPKVKLKDLRG